MPDSAPVHTMGVTADTAPDPVTAARAALHDHKASCRNPGCDACILLAAAWRRALRDSSANRIPAQEAP